MHRIYGRKLALIACCLVFCSFAGSQTRNDPEKSDLLRIVDQNSQLLIDVSDKIWEYAEIALEEYESAELLEGVLEKEGFRVEKDVADLPTAFVATFGSGVPVIGILAEYDALPGLSQDSTPFKKVLQEEGSGHGCGHNLFGAGSLGAALALKKVMEKHAIQGTLKLFGCPAEEDVGGKLYMARAGLFDDLVHIFSARQVEKQFESDISVVLHPLPKVPLMICYWQPEDGLESSLNVFFDETADKNLNADAVFTLGVGLAQMFTKLSLRHGFDEARSIQ